MVPDREPTAFDDPFAADLTDTAESRRSAMLPHILREIWPGASVLDVGSGSGRDVAAMLESGLDAFGVEPNQAMRAKALDRYPGLEGRLKFASLPALGRPFQELRPEGFDAVVCSAVLMHLDSTELAAALVELTRQLRLPDATSTGQPVALLISLPEMDRSRLNLDRDEDGRRFFNHALVRVQELLSTTGMVLKHSSTSHAVLESAGTLWHTLVFRREGCEVPVRG